jgi:hypothetical protein
MTIATEDPEALRELVRQRRSEIVDRVRLQHQLLLLAGGAAAAAAGLLGSGTHVPSGLVYGLGILFLSIAFSMLNHENQILSGAQFLIELPGPDAQAQIAWERHIYGDRRAGWRSADLLVNPFLGAATYAIPALSYLASLVAFIQISDLPFVADLGLELVPLLLAALFFRGVFRVVVGYAELGRAAFERSSDPS